MITSELQSDIMSTRMQPIGNILNKFERLVRDVSREYGKKIELNITGQETELDKTLIEAIRDPLTHIIRNAADHGLETIEERVNAGKNEVGTIFIKSYQESGQVVIEVSDDGRGINAEKVLKKAIDKEIVTQEEASQLENKEIFQFIFHPGFSTADKITNISGRGVGMDVVKTNIEKIGGSVSIHSQLQEGSTFKLRIPLTLAIIPALMVQAQEHTFAIPQMNLEELVLLEGEELSHVENIYGSRFLRLRGELVPLFSLVDELKLAPVSEKTELGDVVNIVVLNAEGRVYALIVDEILDTQEVVVKPLGQKVSQLSFFAGATIMGDGRVALIIDSNGFYQSIHKDKIKKVDQKVDKVVEEQHQESVDLLLFDIQGNEYAIPLATIHRLEEIDQSDITYSAKLPVVNYRGTTMPLIDLQSELNSKEELCVEKYIEAGKAACIVVLSKGHYFGFLVSSIVDIFTHLGDVDSHLAKNSGVHGTIFYQENAVTVIDLFNLLYQGSFSHIFKNELSPYQNKKVLVVDDSSMYRTMEEQMLKELGFQVITAKDGQEAMERVKTHQFDLVLTDIEMPRADGYELASYIRQQQESNQVPVIAISTRVAPEDIEKGKVCGFNHHLEKFNKDEIIKVIEYQMKEAS